MLKLVIDEDLSRSLGKILAKAGYSIFDIRDFGLRGKNDDEIFNFAQENEAILLTGDLGFGNLLKFPLGKHYGIIIIHYPNEMPVNEINKQVLSNLTSIEPDDFEGNLNIIEPGKIRIKRKVA